MIDLGQAPGILSTEDILKLAKDAMKTVIKRVIDDDTEPEKVEQYRKARRNDFAWRGIECAPSRVNNEIVDYTAVGIPLNDKKRQRESNYNFNIIRGDFMKAIAVIGAKAPDVAAVPDEADDEDQVDVAQRADLVAQKICKAEDMDALQAELLLDLSLTTTTFIYTPWVVDGERNGWSEEPAMEPEQVPFGSPTYKCVYCGTETPDEEATTTGVCSNPACSKPLSPEDYQKPEDVTLPKMGQPERYANGGVKFLIRNIMTVTVPFFSKVENGRPTGEWLRDEEEVTPSSVIEIFPDIPKEILERNDSDQSGMGTQIRQQASSENGIRRHRENTVLFSRYWLRPSFLNNFREEEIATEQDAKQNLMKLLKDHFKRGVRVTMVNGEIMDLFEESIDDVWVAVKPTVSKFIFCDPLCHDTIPIQELVNRLGNIGVMTLLRGLPFSLVDSELLDRQTMKDRDPIVAEMLPVKRRTGMSMKDSIAEVPAARMSDQQAPFMGGIREMSRENNGITPPIFGGGVNSQTAHEAEIKKQQALMQLRITYNNTRWGHAKARENAVRQYARYAPGQMKGAPGKGILGPVPGKMVEIADLVDGKYHFEPDEGMPRTFEDERQHFREMTTGNTALPPEQQAAYGLTNAVNLPRAQKYVGTAGWYYPGKDERVKLSRRVLPQLLSAPPNQDGSASVQLDPWDDAALIAQLVGAWLNSDAGDAQAQQNQQGFQNVVAYWQAASKAAAPPPPPPPPPKTSVSIPVDKLNPQEGTEIINKMTGMNLEPPPPPPPGMPPVTLSGKPKVIPMLKQHIGGQGLEVPEPKSPIPQPASPIPGA